MSGSAYPYTPYPAAERLETSGQAFLGGFGAGQQVNQRAQQMDAQQQLMKLRELEDRRIAEMQPLRVRATQQAIDFAAQNQPFNVDRLRLTNEQTRQAIANTAEGRAAAAALQRYILQGGTGAPPPAAPAPPPAASAPRGSGLMAPEGAPAAAPAAAPGPQSSAPEWLSPQFGERRFSGLQLASAGVNDYTGLPTGMAPPTTEEAVQGPTRGGTYAEDAAAGAYPAPVTPIAPPTTFAPMPAEVQAYLQTQTPDQLRQIIRRGERSFFGAPSPGRVSMAEYARQELGQRSGATPQAPTSSPSPTAGFTPEQMQAATEGRGDQAEMAPQVAPQEGAGLRPQGAQTPEQIAAELNNRIDQLTTETPRGMDALEPWRIGVESRALEPRERNIQVRERQVASMRQEAALIARQNPAAALQMLNVVREAEVALQTEREAVALARANLNGRNNLANFMSGNYAGLADDIYRASNGQLRLQPRADGTFNIWGPEGERAPRATGVSTQDIINRGRELYDDNYKTQMAGIIQRQTERRGQIFEAYIKGFEESLKNASATSREVAVARAQEAARAANRDPNIRVTSDPTSGVITIYDATGRTPIRSYRPGEITDARGRKVWGMVPVEIAPGQTR